MRCLLSREVDAKLNTFKQQWSVTEERRKRRDFRASGECLIQQCYLQKPVNVADLYFMCRYILYQSIGRYAYLVDTVDIIYA